VSDACFLSGLIKVETELDGDAHPWRPKLVYHYIQWKNIVPDFVVDITGFTKKLKRFWPMSSMTPTARSKKTIIKTPTTFCHVAYP
jgi:hypothetical protein